MKQLQSKLDNTKEQQRVSHKEAIIARQEAEKARAKRDEAVANLQSATAAAADGGEEAMRVIHEYNVAAQKQEVRLDVSQSVSMLATWSRMLAGAGAPRLVSCAGLHASGSRYGVPSGF